MQVGFIFVEFADDFSARLYMLKNCQTVDSNRLRNDKSSANSAYMNLSWELKCKLDSYLLNLPMIFTCM